MKELVKYTSKQLREALTKRIELEQKTEVEEGEITRQKAVLYLSGKKFLIERHLNPACINLYEVDTDYYPTTKENKWVTVKLISSVYLMYNIEEDESLRIDDEIRGDVKLDFSTYDNLKPSFNREERKYKHFSPDVVLEKVESISEDKYREAVNVSNKIKEMVGEQFSKFQN